MSSPLSISLLAGGYIIVDDFSDWRPCMAAVDEFRTVRGIVDPLILIPHMPGISFICGVHAIKPTYSTCTLAHMMYLLSLIAGEQNRGVYWRKTEGDLSVPMLSKYSLYPCLGDGRRNHGPSLRVHGGYSPNPCIQMPPNGPPGVNILNLKGRTDLFMCYDG